jgi:hypothetical protein
MYRRSAVALAVFISSLLCSAFAQTISAKAASAHIGEYSTVCGTITGEHTAEHSVGTPTFINLDGVYPHQVFTILIWGVDRGNIGDLPATGHICATGVITQYREVPQIILKDSHSWYVPK